jgi:hypothetical protein
MVARPKESRNERETAERGAFAVGRAAPVSRAAPRVALVVPEAAVRAAQRVEAVDHARAVVEAAQQVGREEVAAARDDDSIGAGRPVADERREGRQRREVVDVVDVDEAQRRRLAGVGRRRRAGGEELVAADAAVGARGRRPARLVEGGAGEARRRRAVHAVRQLRRRRRDDRAHPCAQSGASLGCFYHCPPRSLGTVPSADARQLIDDAVALLAWLSPSTTALGAPPAASETRSEPRFAALRCAQGLGPLGR